MIAMLQYDIANHNVMVSLEVYSSNRIVEL
jgi:hypothetical protein